MTYVHTITKADVGKSRIVKESNCPTCGHNTGVSISTITLMGGIMLHDVGKRIYESKGVFGVENDVQRDARLGKCICSDTDLCSMAEGIMANRDSLFDNWANIDGVGRDKGLKDEAYKMYEKENQRLKRHIVKATA